VSVGSNGAIITSPDGMTWEKQTVGTTNSLNNIIYANGMFVAIGASTITSSDGFTWAVQTQIIQTVCRIAYGNNLFVAIEKNGGTIINSSDFFTWKKQISNITTGLYEIIYEN
jgi:hypothetical protein